MKQNIYKVFNHDQDYITKYIYDYNTMQSHTLDESEEVEDNNKKIELLNENIKILKVFIEKTNSDILSLIKKYNNHKIFGLVILILSFIFSCLITYFINPVCIPNFMCLILFIIGAIIFFDSRIIDKILNILKIEI